MLLTTVNLPVQLNPSPSKPTLHMQFKLPSVSVQLALELHGYVSSSHSLISAEDDHCKNFSVSNCKIVLITFAQYVPPSLYLHINKNITLNAPLRSGKVLAK